MERALEPRRFGANVCAEGVEFRVWAPRAQRVAVCVESDVQREYPLDREDDGCFAALVPGLEATMRYRYRLDDGASYPDPCSRFQPAGPLEASMVVDPDAFAWQHSDDWPGVEMRGQVIYEMHIGTFTQAGTFDAAIRELPALHDLGVTVLELMPVGEFPGRWNWGYDGVGLYAPYHGYGDADALRRFVDAAHGFGLAVVLDVVYNHVGPRGNFLERFSENYFSERYQTDWGKAINFDGPHSGPVREFFIGNACYWVSEFRLDGLRIDATQCIFDAGPCHILAELSARVRASAEPRKILLLAENEPQRAEYLRPTEQGGFDLDAMWNDDFHHSVRVAATGRREGYFHDYSGDAQELVSAAKRGFLYQGQYYDWQKAPRGSPTTGFAPWSMIAFTQNHDQVANTFGAKRLHELTSPGRFRALTALLLLAPHTPMLFMGQEFAAAQPFPFLADHDAELAPQVHEGRREFLQQFATYATPAIQARVPDPAAESTFVSAKLDHAQRATNAWSWRLHRDLIAIRKSDAVIAAQGTIDGAVFGERAFVLRWFGAAHGDRLLVVNLGAELALRSPSEPLLAPLASCNWQMQWSSDDPLYDGPGALSPCKGRGWIIPGESATLLRST